MRVALYYPWIYLTSGVERTLLELSRRSRHDWTLYTSHFDAKHTYAGLSEQKVVTVGEVSVSRDIKSVARAGWQILNLRLPLKNHDFLVVSSEGMGDFITFRNNSLPMMCLCFTPLRVVFDPVYRERAHQDRSVPGRVALRVGSWAFRQLDKAAWKKYKSVIFISSEARKRAIAGGLTNGSHTEILHPAPAFEVDKPSDRFDRYFFVPGRIMWTKNLELAIEAFWKFKVDNPDLGDFRLIFAGIVDKKSEPYFARLKQLAAKDPSIEFRILPSDDEMAELYSNCYCMLFTAFNEDWGLVPIEAMTFGKPVISVNRGGPLESIQPGVQGFLEEPEPEAFASRMVQLVRDPQLARRLGRAGFERAKRYSWGAFVDRIDDEIDSLCGVSPDVSWMAKTAAVGQAVG